LRHRPPIAAPLAAALFVALALTACASAPQDAPKGPRSTLFISPAGEPFHAGPGQPYPVGQWFAQADANHDGKLTRDEFRADFTRFFKMLDQDHNGVLDGADVQHYEQEIAPEVLPRLAQVRGGFPGERGGPGNRQLAETPPTRGGQVYDGAPAYSLLNVSEPVASADDTFDGKITLEAFLRAADRRFALLNKNKDGYLTLDTLPRTPEQIAVEGRHRR
jgi:hypothetical protein